MKLQSISINLNGDEQTNSWFLDLTSLTNLNLLVGRNSTGKTRAMLWLETLISLINRTQTDDFFVLGDYTHTCFKLDFKTNSGLLTYQLSTIFKNKESEDEIINVEEKIIYNNEVVLNRNSTKTEIYSFSQKKYLQISPPDDKLIVHIRRDKEEFPFLEELALWASKAYFYSFSGELENLGNFNPSPTELSDLSLQRIVENLKFLGYDIKNIFITELGQGKVKQKDLRLVENRLDKSLRTYELSQGLQRVFDILAMFEELSKNKNALFIAIDNLGEGLDYERATKLGKLLVEKIENSNIQLIATSNDSFLMDVIPIKYWNILQRDGNTVRSLNYQNSKDLFDKFRLTGLSNFDLFSSDYLFQKQ